MAKIEQRMLTSGEASKALGIAHSRLLYLLKTRQITEPHRLGIMRAWTGEDIQQVRRYLQTQQYEVRNR